MPCCDQLLIFQHITRGAGHAGRYWVESDMPPSHAVQAVSGIISFLRAFQHDGITMIKTVSLKHRL